MIIFKADDPLVLDGTYDMFGWKPGEEARAKKAKAVQSRLEAESMAKKKAEKKVKKASAPKKTARRAPRAQALPGMADRAIKPLEDVAAAYADLRDARISLNKEEKALKTQAIRLMHKLGKTVYVRDGIRIMLIAGDEDIRVKVPKKITAAKDVEDEPIEAEAAGEITDDDVVDEDEAQE